MRDEPKFTVKPAFALAPGCYLTEVNVSTEGGLWHRFTGRTEREANTKARAHINAQLEKHHKSVAARYARAKGRGLQVLKAASGPAEG